MDISKDIEKKALMQKIIFNSEIKGIDEKEGTITASVSTNTIDRMGDVLDPKGVDLTNFKKNPVVLFAHNYSAPPIAKALWIKRDGEKGVVSKMKFADTPRAKEVFELYKGGFMKAFSVGFIPKAHERIEEDAKTKTKAHTVITKWELLEFSAVPVPANPDALALAMQKGIKLSDDIKKAFNTPVVVGSTIAGEKSGEDLIDDFYYNADDTDNALKKAWEDGKKAAEEALKKIDKKGNHKFADYMETLEQLKQQQKEYLAEIKRLKEELQQKDTEPKKQMLSEMTDEEILKKMEEIFTGVIRTATGKVS